MLSALVPLSSIRPVDTSVQVLGVKRTSGFVRACGELARHRELLARPPSNSDDSSDEPDSLHVATSRNKANTQLYDTTLLLSEQSVDCDFFVCHCNCH